MSDLNKFPIKALIVDANENGSYNIVVPRLASRVYRDVWPLAVIGQSLGGSISGYAKNDLVLISFVDGFYGEPVILGAYNKSAPAPTEDVAAPDCFSITVRGTTIQVSKDSVIVIQGDNQIEANTDGVSITTSGVKADIGTDKMQFTVGGQVYDFTDTGMVVAAGTDTPALTQPLLQVLTQIHTILTQLPLAFAPLDAAVVTAIGTQTAAIAPNLNPSIIGAKKVSLQ